MTRRSSPVGSLGSPELLQATNRSGRTRRQPRSETSRIFVHSPMRSSNSWKAKASRLDRHAELGCDGSRGLIPGASTDTRHQREARVVDQVQRRGSFAVVLNPDVWEMRARDGVWLKIEFRIPFVFWKRFRGENGAAAIALPQLDAVGVELIVHEVDAGEKCLAPFLAALGIAEEFGKIGA